MKRSLKVDRPAAFGARLLSAAIQPEVSLITLFIHGIGDAIRIHGDERHGRQYFCIYASHAMRNRWLMES